MFVHLAIKTEAPGVLKKSKSVKWAAPKDRRHGIELQCMSEVVSLISIQEIPVESYKTWPLWFGSQHKVTFKLVQESLCVSVTG